MSAFSIAAATSCGRNFWCASREAADACAHAIEKSEATMTSKNAQRLVQNTSWNGGEASHRRSAKVRFYWEIDSDFDSLK
jgi:hypothetical protein